MIYEIITFSQSPWDSSNMNSWYYKKCTKNLLLYENSMYQRGHSENLNLSYDIKNLCVIQWWAMEWYNLNTISIQTLQSRSGLLNLLCGAGNFSKIWSACRQHEIQHTEWRMNKYMYIHTIILCLYWSIHNKKHKYIHNNRKNVLKNEVHNLR
jgi:hypothetical protein